MPPRIKTIDLRLWLVSFKEGRKCTKPHPQHSLLAISLHQVQEFNFWVHIFNIVLNDNETSDTLRIWNYNVDSCHQLSVQQVGGKLAEKGRATHQLCCQLCC